MEPVQNKQDPCIVGSEAATASGAAEVQPTQVLKEYYRQNKGLRKIWEDGSG
jgi:hypothetical protein